MQLAFAVPDHPWVDSANGAAVRIAMTVGQVQATSGRLLSVQSEVSGADGEMEVQFRERTGVIHADLKLGANVLSATPLLANGFISNRGVIPHGTGFVVTEAEARQLGLGTVPGLEQHIREYRNGRDLASRPREVMVIDMQGLDAEEMRHRFPAAYQHLLERVKPERDLNPERSRREGWWLFARPNTELRRSLVGLTRFIATVYVAKHRVFQFLALAVLPDDGLVAIATGDALWLGVLSTEIHVAWALAAGGRLGVGNDPRYNKTRCFETEPHRHSRRPIGLSQTDLI